MTMTNNNIAILMATYNGERYLKEQINSLLAQTYQDWHLYVHDDGSADNTVTIVKDYAKHYPDKVTLLEYPSQGGACMNFLSLMEKVEAPYYMFCDQDDVWLPNKIELSIQAMETLQQQYPQTPIIICTDMYVVDQNLSIINNSWWNYSRIYPMYIRAFEDCAATAGVTGCTMLFNHEAKDCCMSAGPKVFMHDCWVCICALKKHGILHCIAEPLNKYRQHGGNTLGAGISVSKMNLIYRLTHIKSRYLRNKAQFNMLNLLGYGSIFKYIKYKIKYQQRIRQGKY